MEIEKTSVIKKGIPLILLGLFIFILYVHFFVGFEDILNTFLLTDPIYYSLALVMFFFSMIFYSLAWANLLNILSIKTNFREVFIFNWVGTFVDLLIPAESLSGEITKTYLMSKGSKRKIGKVVASVISHRILKTAIGLAGMIVATLFFFFKYDIPATVLWFIFIIALGASSSLFLMVYLSFKENITKRLVNWLVKLLKRIFKKQSKKAPLISTAKMMLKEFHKGVYVLGRHPKKLILPVIFSIMTWLSNVLISFFVFSSLNVSVHFSAIIIVFSVTMAIEIIPLLIPGEIGIVEIVMTSLYAVLLPGITPAIAATATILIRALTLWTKLFISGIAVQYVGIKMIK